VSQDWDCGSWMCVVCFFVAEMGGGMGFFAGVFFFCAVTGAGMGFFVGVDVIAFFIGVDGTGFLAVIEATGALRTGWGVCFGVVPGMAFLVPMGWATILDGCDRLDLVEGCNSDWMRYGTEERAIWLMGPKMVFGNGNLERDHIYHHLDMRNNKKVGQACDDER
jgi:hypothetical protein